jgi:hypothetical protein
MISPPDFSHIPVHWKAWRCFIWVIGPVRHWPCLIAEFSIGYITIVGPVELVFAVALDVRVADRDVP